MMKRFTAENRELYRRWRVSGCFKIFRIYPIVYQFAQDFDAPIDPSRVDRGKAETEVLSRLYLVLLL